MTATRFAAIYLLGVLCFGWGLFTAWHKVFPWTYIEAVQEFVRGDVDDSTSLVQKLKNDLGVSPERFIRSYAAADTAGFRQLALDGIRGRRQAPRFWMSPDAPRRHRLIVGAFDFEDAFWGALLLDPAGRVLRRWRMNGEIPALTDQPDELKNLYGVAFFPDGSAVFTMQEPSGGLVKIDACSRLRWTKKGLFHHVIAPTEDEDAFWTFGGRQSDLHPRLLLIDAATGETEKSIDMAAVAKANPETFIFDLQRAEMVEHATHPNDIEPLPAALADAHPRFAAGDLLLSYHTTNLIFVLDPDTLKIKWWYVGAGDGQHDPDWQGDGTISLFNNNRRVERRAAPRISTIVSVDPARGTHRTVLDGAAYGFYSNFNGNHQVLRDGSVIVGSSAQGRAFEVDIVSGAITFDFVNSYEWESGRTLHLSDAMVVDGARAARWASRRCPIESASKGDQQ